MTPFGIGRHVTRTSLQLILALLLAVTGCRQAELAGAPERRSAPDSGPTVEAEARLTEMAADKARAESAAAAARAELEAAERIVAEREAQLAERERQLREARALSEERARFAERSSALDARERELEARIRDLETRDRELEAREFDLARREEAAATSEAALPEPPSAVPGEAGAGQSSTETDSEGRQASEREAASLLPGKVFEVEILETLSSRDRRVGESFSARLVHDLRNEEGTLVMPAGTEIVGRVTHVTPLRKVGGRAELGIEFTHAIISPDQTVEIRASLLEVGADKRKDKKKILLATAAGAILGGVLGGDAEAAVAGAAVGAAATTAVVARSEGRDAEIPAGEMLALQLEEVVTVSIEMTGLVDR